LASFFKERKHEPGIEVDPTEEEMLKTLESEMEKIRASSTHVEGA